MPIDVNTSHLLPYLPPVWQHLQSSRPPAYALKCRKSMLWRNKTRRLQRLYPLGPYKNIGMYAPPLRKKKDGLGLEPDSARSDWLKANYHDDFNDFDLDDDATVVGQDDLGPPGRTLMDGFDRLLTTKTETMKVSMNLTIVGVVVQALHLLLYIALYSGANYVHYPQFQGNVGIGLFHFTELGSSHTLISAENFKSKAQATAQQVRRFVDNIPIYGMLLSFISGTVTGFLCLVMLMVALIMRKRKFGLRVAILICSLVQFFSCLASFICLNFYGFENPFNYFQEGRDFAMYWLMMMLIGFLCTLNAVVVLTLPF